MLKLLANRVQNRKIRRSYKLYQHQHIGNALEDLARKLSRIIVIIVLLRKQLLQRPINLQH